jgi:pimeloyl-ACP methyl ester carboxylesterase
MLRRVGGGAGTALAVSALLSTPTMSIAKAAMAAGRSRTMPAKPNVVLVHGAFADASSWSQVIQRLQAAGHAVSAVQLDLAALADDIARTRTVLAAQDGPTVLAGHSYGGAVITGAGVDAPHVISLVYVAAFAPDEGETLPEAVAGFPAAPGNAHLVPDYRKDFLRVDPAAYPQFFMQDVHPVEARALAVTQRALSASAFGVKAGTPAWRSLPAWYLVAEDDRMINPDAERHMAKRMNATTTVVRGSSHAAMISHPDEVVAAIRAAARVAGTS